MKKADFRVGSRPAWWQGFSKALPVCGGVSIRDESHGMSCPSVLSLPRALFSLQDLASFEICSWLQGQENKHVFVDVWSR